LIGAEWTGQHIGQIEDPNSFEQPIHGVSVDPQPDLAHDRAPFRELGSHECGELRD
jgi:hypothetical protein